MVIAIVYTFACYVIYSYVSYRLINLYANSASNCKSSDTEFL